MPSPPPPPLEETPKMSQILSLFCMLAWQCQFLFMTTRNHTIMLIFSDLLFCILPTFDCMLLYGFTPSVETKNSRLWDIFFLIKINSGGSFSFILIIIFKYSLLWRSVLGRRDWSESRQQEEKRSAFLYEKRESASTDELNRMTFWIKTSVRNSKPVLWGELIYRSEITFTLLVVRLALVL